MWVAFPAISILRTVSLQKKFIKRQIHNKGYSMHDIGYRERGRSHSDDDDDDGCAVYLHLCCTTKKNTEVVSEHYSKATHLIVTP